MSNRREIGTAKLADGTATLPLPRLGCHILTQGASRETPPTLSAVPYPSCAPHRAPDSRARIQPSDPAFVRVFEGVLSRHTGC